MANSKTLTARSLEEFMAVKFPERSWGAWELDGVHLIYRLSPSRYPIDLTELTSSARMLDTIFQVAVTKTWATDDCIVGLVMALNAIFIPQANLCSSGQDKRLTPQAIKRLIDCRTVTGPRRKSDKISDPFADR